MNEELRQHREAFINQWGALGTSWGISRTMAQIHALLMVSPRPLTTDDVMEQLQISRGNANSNLRELVNWGLLRVVRIAGERKELFEAEKDVWSMFCIISRERKRREIEPALRVLDTCLASSSSQEQNPEAVAFFQQLDKLRDFISRGSAIMDKVSATSESRIISYMLKFF